MIITFDKNISLKAKGMYLLLNEMLNNNKIITLDSIREYTTDGETAVRNSIQELINNNYLERNMLREKGKIRGVEYKIKK